MATVLRNPRIGDLAYPAYSPQMAGVVVALVKIPYPSGFARGASAYEVDGVRIRMINGKEVETSSPQDYRALVADHRRKADAGETLIRSLEAMAAGAGGE